MSENETNNQEQAKQKISLEDLPVEESKQDEVKGGPRGLAVGIGTLGGGSGN